MDWKINELIFCFFLLFGYILEPISSARQNPLKDPKICGRPICDLDTDKFHWNNKIRYKYDYMVHIRTEFSGSGDNTSDLYLKSKINLIFPTKCEGILTITNVELREISTISLNNNNDNNNNDDDETPVYDYNNYDYGEQIIPDTTIDSNLNKNLDTTLHNKSFDLANSLEKYDLKFSFHDGLISEVCPDQYEPIWVLNFKKGIISQLQNTMLRFDVDLNTTETDISGICNVAYSLEGADGTNVLIKKIKNIDSCRNRIKMQSILQTTPYHFRDDKVIWPILNSNSYCNITVDHNIYQQVNCHEKHQLIPFSHNTSGAVTETYTRLILEKEETIKADSYDPYKDDENVIKRRSMLLFDHTPSLKPTHGEIRASRDLLKKICDLGFPNIQREFIETFTKFLETTRLLSYKALHQLLLRSVSVCESGNGRNHVLESLPYIGSTASYQLMRDEIIGETVPKETAQSWMTSMSFLLRPDEETLETFYTLLEYGKKKINPEYTLGASAVVHTFCRHNSDCNKNEKVLKIVRKLEEEFSELLQSDLNERRVHERITILLKAIGNIGVMTEDFENKLKSLILMEDNLTTETRLEIVLAFRKFDCNKNKDFFLDIYRNFMLNSEIRILSYLQVMRCPDYLSINEIKRVLETEEINQVGSFVWSHLKNIAKSASPVRVEAQGLLADDDLGNKFRMDIRKFSRNYEYSLFFDEYNFGAEAESNIIFGTDSYLPRIVNLNFTADLFGESVNFFEITGRAQGFEQFIVSIFGPKGPLNSEVVRNKFKFLNRFMGDDSSENSNEDFLDFEKLRLKRTPMQNEEDENYNFENDDNDKDPEKVKTHDREIHKEVDQLGYKLKYDHGHPRATLGLRVFGNDLRYISVDGMNEVMGLAQKLNPFLIAAKILSGREITYSQSGIFLDASYNVPLAVGLPLGIKAFGASSVDLRMSGNLKRYENEGDWNFDIQGKIKPSVSVDVLTTMESDFYYAVSGIRVKSNLYSSSHLETNVKVRGSKLVSVSFSLPQDKNEIFSAKSDLIVFKYGEELQQSGIERRSSNTTCTWPILDSALGLKVCSHYSLPDLSNATDVTYPGLLLSGPTNIRMYLEKTDLSIKKFVLEYRWDQVQETTTGSLLFYTPKSVVTRILTANITKTPNALNGSLSFVLGDNSYSAVGHYKNDPVDQRFEFFVESNGQKNLALYANMNRTEIRNGYLYLPEFKLYVNEAIIAGLSGTLKISGKNGIKQSEIDVLFETRKLQARLYGYVTESEIKTSTKLRLDYRFEENEKEKIEFESVLENRSKKSRTDYKGNVKLVTSAYPKLNFAGSLFWLSVLAHTECRLTYNNAPDLIDKSYNTDLRLVFIKTEPDVYAERLGKTMTLAKFEISRLKANIDFGCGIKYEEIEKNGTAHAISTGLRYAPGKEVTGNFLIHFPRRNLFAINTFVNITVPDFDSATMQLGINEVRVKDYKFDFAGTWFTNHSISIDGNFKDNSTRSHVIKFLKVVVRSPSFEEITADVVYRRSALEMFVNVRGTYNKDPYGIMIKYTGLNSGQRNTYLEFKRREEIYWLSAKLLKDVNKLLQIDIHWDKARDINVNVRAVSLPLRKELSVELKWDANRDPSQRLAIQAQYNNPRYRKYDANFMLTYPEKTLSCGFDVYTGGPNYYGQGRVSWNADEAIIVNYDAGFIPKPDGSEYNSWGKIEINTPFDGWRRNHGKCGLYIANNLILANSSMLWADNQDINVIYKSNYVADDNEMKAEINFAVNSTISDVPTMSSHFRHSQTIKRVYTDADFRYKTSSSNDLQVYSIKSDWDFDQKDNYKNITGKVSLRSPFEGYQTGNLNLKMSINDIRKIQAAASLKFEDKRFTLVLDGYIKKFNDNMLQVNITTPLPKFPTITGRFGFIERNRHAVTMLTSPGGSMGAEIMLAIDSIADFDIQFNLATPIESFQRVLLVAKLKPDTMDYRGGLNEVTLGFTGIWRYVNTTDMEYSYRVFTPLKKFEESGLVFKYLMSSEEFLLNAYGRFSTYKLGVLLNGKPFPRLITELDTKAFDVQLTNDPEFQIARPDYIDEEEESDDDDAEELFSYIGKIELDTLLFPTIKGMIDIQENSDYYFVLGNLDIPQGRISFQDNVFYPDYFHVENVLKMSTPFEKFKDIKAKFEYEIQYQKSYVFGLKVANKSPNDTTKVGYFVNYTILNEQDIRTREVGLTIYTPFEHFQKVDLMGSLEMEDYAYKANITTRTNETTLSLAGTLEYDEDNYMDITLGLDLDTKEVPNYGCWFHVKKDLSGNEHSIEFAFDVRENSIPKNFKFLTLWKVNGTHFVDGRCRIQTNILPLKIADSSVFITRNPNPILNFDLKLIDRYGNKTEYKARADRKRNVVNIDLNTPIKNFENISMYGLLTKAKMPNDYTFSGNLSRNSEISDIDGTVSFLSDFPVKVYLNNRPKVGPPGVIEFELKSISENYAQTFRFNSIENGKMCQISGGYTVYSLLNWEVSVLVQSTQPEISRIVFNTKIKPKSKSHFEGRFDLETPWRHLGIETVRGLTNAELTSESGRVKTEYEIENYKGKGDCTWTFIMLEDMQIGLETEIERIDTPSEPKIMTAYLMYINPNRNFQRLLSGGKLNVHSKWILDVNGTIAVSSGKDIRLGLAANLPQLISNDTHRFGIRYRGNLLEQAANNFKEPIDVFAEGKYEANIKQTKYLIKGNFRNVADIQGMGHIEWGAINQFQVIDGDFQILLKDKLRKEFYAKATTPYYQNEETFYVTGHYDNVDLYHLLQCTLKSPASKKLFETDMAVLSAVNMNGFVNSTIPFFKLDWLRGDFNFTTHGGSSYRYMKGTWPTNSAFFKSNSDFVSHNLDRDLSGTITIDVPLTSRHHADIDYKLEERELIKTGHANVVYNDRKVLQGKYNCNSEQRSGFEKDIIDITLENEFKPLGIHYIHSKEYKDAEFPDYDMKHAEVFELRKEDKFNLTGELHIKTTDSGQEYKIVAIHPNRTVILSSEYDNQDTISKQKSKLQLSPTAWIAYNVMVENNTTPTKESQKFYAELSYPKRTLSADGTYFNTDEEFDSNIALKWTANKKNNRDKPEQKVIKTGFNWRSEPLTGIDREHQTAMLTIGHPSFSKDMTLKGFYYRSPIELLKFGLKLDYSNDPRHLLNVNGVLRDESQQNSGIYNFSYKLDAEHNISDFILNVHGIASAKPAYYYTLSKGLYKRSYFPIKHGSILSKLDIVKKEIEYERKSPYKAVRFWMLPYANYPIYGLNGTIWDTPEVNSTGFLYVNLLDKFTRMEINMTEDASQNIQMIGSIPDARNAYFDLWRNYEEIRIIDVSSYIKMNHSRLVTGQFHWRPKMKSELKEKMKQIGDSFYDSFSDGIDFWIKTIYQESSDVLNDVWYHTKEQTKGFMTDIGELQVLEDDITDFRRFVNSSYEANDFYVKTLVNFTLTVLDELAIRDHIESLPKIVSEFWQVMGESGKALRKSILWLFETVKSAYHKALEIITKFLHGESFNQLSKLMEAGIEKYDKFIKDLHISFIKYVQNIWVKGTAAATTYWRIMLKKLEPHIFRFIHYLESSLWSFSKEMFDFIYNRTSEIAESPYYSQFSRITQDIDHLYHDIEDNDAITNFKKYSAIAWEFIKEKYFKLVPFGKELNEVITELIHELEKLKDLAHVKLALQKLNEIKMKLQWISEELELERRIHQLWRLIRNKLGKYTMTALQTDDMYREAKTLFVFDPESGIIDLQQKLPMSWHAFNETPKFEEIPEYKMINDIQNFFGGSNFSIIGTIYSIRSNLEPKTWLPPYSAHSLLIGSRHYMTFDKKFIGLQSVKYDILDRSNNQDKCSYLLAHDFFQNNFTLLLEPSVLIYKEQKILTRKLTLLTDKEHIEIDINADYVKIGNNPSPTLPVKLGDAVIYRDSDVVVIHSEQEFTLNCNLQFDLCWLELGSWYFGQTAGLLGTMNNEPFDDLTKSNGKITTNQNEFIKSWSLNDCQYNDNKNYNNKNFINNNNNYNDNEIIQLCDEFFKKEYFANCFEFIDPTPFYNMCIDMGSNSITTVLKDNHPAKKGACTAALGYIEACDAMKIPLRVPDKCVHCNLSNGTYVAEGTFITLEADSLPDSADIVFIVEAKPCNHNITQSKNIMTVVSALDKELNDVKMKNNRYSVIAFGGRSPFDKPRNIVHKNKVFTSDINLLKNYFDHINTDNGSNNDIFGAISIASKSIFRPGVSKIFILLPCSSCSAKDMKFDYASVLQLLQEDGIQLHILMDQEFTFEKHRLNRVFFGLDRTLAYSKRDNKKFTGDEELRTHVRLTKAGLGTCTALAIESNGSVFTAKKLKPEKTNPVKKISSVFAKRVVKTAIQKTCQICECTGHNTGIAYMTCTSCDYGISDSIAYDDLDFFGNDFNFDWDDDMDDSDLEDVFTDDDTEDIDDDDKKRRK
ncbi:uncharacterized protein LOC129618631 [Condylostylus longicornis]|uniref:uncharacterized protein LOC129618631 n=1 Tax=Condylostylus longicornis TaxID=2530218 RepID=UPI00244DE85D|nr:uncharacterized protein LOC129618631 [Condylostylus longicornis]